MLSTQFNRDNQYQAITKPSLLAGCIALALLPSAAFAAPATEETVIVEGSATTPDDGENGQQRNVYLCGYQNADDST